MIVKLKNGQLENIYTDLDLEVIVIDNKNKTTIYGESLEVDVHPAPTLVMASTTEEERGLVIACCAANDEEAIEFLNEIAEREQNNNCCCEEIEELVRRTL